MAYALEILKANVEKHTLVIMRPRERVAGDWSYIHPNISSTPFTKGPVTKVIDPLDFEYEQAAAYPPSSGEFYHDEDAGILYLHRGNTTPDGDVFDVSGNPDGSIAYDYAGCTVEYEIRVATSDFTGPRDPLDASSAPIHWRPALTRSPEAASGARDSLYGFNPLLTTSIELNNQDGWLMPHFHGTSWMLGSIEAYVMAGKDMDFAVSRSNVKQIFLGYMGKPVADTAGSATIECSDFLAYLDRRAFPASRYSQGEFPNIDPRAIANGAEWWIRRVRGMVDNFIPVNIDYDETPATNVNRDFATHEGTGTDGTYGATVDHANAGNSATRTHLTTTPKVNVGDSVIIVKGGTDRYAIVTSVNRVSNYFDHSSIAGTFAPGDSIVRYFIGSVRVKDSDGNWWQLFAGRNFTRINKATLGNNPDWLGFRLADNWEGDLGFPETFDPAKHEICCRVYGTTDLDEYASTDLVGAVTDYGGVNSRSDSLLYWLLTQAGIEPEMIDQDSFEGVATNHSLGLAIPFDRATTKPPTYKELIQLVLQSMIWKMGYVDSGAALKIGLLETGPFVASADFEVDAVDFRAFSFEHDYTDIYSDVELSFSRKEVILEGVAEPLGNDILDTECVAYAHSLVAEKLHFVDQVFELDVLQFARDEAELMATRYAYALGDRRAYYNLTLGPEYLNRAGLGTSYQVKRQQLPGYENVQDEIRERQTMLIEVQKSAQGVTLTLEDQKGIQDNSGDWS